MTVSTAGTEPWPLPLVKRESDCFANEVGELAVFLRGVGSQPCVKVGGETDQETPVFVFWSSFDRWQVHTGTPSTWTHIPVLGSPKPFRVSGNRHTVPPHQHRPMLLR